MAAERTPELKLVLTDGLQKYYAETKSDCFKRWAVQHTLRNDEDDIHILKRDVDKTIVDG